MHNAMPEISLYPYYYGWVEVFYFDVSDNVFESELNDFISDRRRKYK